MRCNQDYAFHPLIKTQIIFLACGLLTIGLSVPVWFLLPDTPMQASFLTPSEKLILSERLRVSRSDPATKRSWEWEQVAECITDPKTWCWVLMHTFLA